MKTIKDYISKPSEAITAMIEGLIEQEARPDFIVAMNTFGAKNDYTCFGCAATCTIQKIARINLTTNNIRGVLCRSRALDLDIEDLNYFEIVMNEVRLGYVISLIYYLELRPTIPYEVMKKQDWKLNTDNWKEQLHLVEEYRDKLIELGY